LIPDAYDIHNFTKNKNLSCTVTVHNLALKFKGFSSITGIYVADKILYWGISSPGIIGMDHILVKGRTVLTNMQ